ncbi:integral membrane protein [Colletotrichum cuscutae]|uniref:Integral membrane protein n=1 Tax=Colletotrichum cuscutae TaxID=1209917 RepID=A0AAI9V2N2_9PEZI|nr:integral membrane protein [Colletotrichum cuscutae]
MSAAAQRGTLAPLPDYHRRGLIVLTIFSFLSAIATTGLWLFITYKLLSYRKTRPGPRQRSTRPQDADVTDLPDLSLGLDASCAGTSGFARIEELDRLATSQGQAVEAASAPENREEQEVEEARNPFPILIYNLLLADMMEAVAYALSISWVSADGIFAPSSVCWAQGWLGSTSNLAASLFLAVISINTFLTVGLGYKPPPWTIYTSIGFLWIFDFTINGAGVIFSEIHPAVPQESFFMRANVWCWISTSYESWRFWAHYFWVIVSIALTLSLYSFVFFTLWRQKRSCRHLPEKRASQSEASESGFEPGHSPEVRRPSGYHPAFLAYPFVYVACSTPLIIGRITSLLGIDLGILYFAFAGSILAANGLFNSILWITTIVFSEPQDAHNTGLDQFAFVRTPIRDYGHTVIISGPVSRRVPEPSIVPSGGRKEWWWWKHGGQRGWGRSYANMHETPRVSAVEVHDHTLPVIVEGPYIQMDIVTAVTVEHAEIQPIPPGRPQETCPPK